MLKPSSNLCVKLNPEFYELIEPSYETRMALISAVNHYLSSRSTSWFAEEIQKLNDDKSV